MKEFLNSVVINTKRGKEKPIYEQIAFQIKNKLESSEIPPGSRLPAISEMMKKWSVAYPTIKTALDILEGDNLIKVEPGRGKGPLILGQRKESKKLKFAFHRWSNSSQFLQLENGIRKFAAENQVKFSVLDSSLYKKNFTDSLVAESIRCNGLICYPMDTEEYLTAIRKIIENGINVVFVDRSFPSLNVSSICHDDFAGGYEACTHLINQHDCPVYYFGNTLRPSSSHLRYEGWFRAMRENYPHLSIDKKFILESPLPEAEAASAFHNKWEKLFYQSACEYLNSIKDEKLCVFAVNDDAARVFMDAAKDTGRVVGENFFIVGFGDKPFCEKIKPTLSSVMQHDKKMGYEAAALLRDIISNPDLSLHKINRNVFVQLKVRASSLKN